MTITGKALLRRYRIFLLYLRGAARLVTNDVVQYGEKNVP